MGKAATSRQKYDIRINLRRKLREVDRSLAAKAIGDPSVSSERADLLRRANALPNGTRLIYRASRLVSTDASQQVISASWERLERMVSAAEAELRDRL